MRACDVMTSSVTVARPDTPIREVARLMTEHGVSGLPVVDAEQRVLGMITEGDLLHRTEIETVRHARSLLRDAAASTHMLEQAYRKQHAATAGEVMSGEVIAVAEDTPLVEVADLLERHRIKRVPVLRDARLVGIVSRSNLVRALACSVPQPQPAAVPTAGEVRDALLTEMAAHRWDMPRENVIVNGDVVHLWGVAASEEPAAEMCRAAARVAPGKRVQSHLEFPPALPGV